MKGMHSTMELLTARAVSSRRSNRFADTAAVDRWGTRRIHVDLLDSVGAEIADRPEGGDIVLIAQD